MFRHIVSAVLIFMLGCDAGFLTRADEDDMAKVEAAVGQDGPSNIQLRYFMTLDRMQSATDSDKVVGRVRCEDGEEWDITIGNIAAYFREFLEEGPTSPHVATEFMDWMRKRHSESGCRVDFEGYPSLWPPGAGDDHSSNRDLAEWVVGLSGAFIAEHPRLMVVLGVASMGGVLVAILPSIGGIGLVLCSQSEAIMCPDDPGAPGIPQPGPGGGER